MNRLLAVFVVLGLIAPACSDDGPAEPSAAAGDAGAVQTDDAPDDGEPAGMMLDELNVAYLLEWPTANQVAQARRTYDEALGMTVNWIPFASGGGMAQAMEAGDIDISYSQGVTSFANSVTGGADLLLVGVAVSYADADNCVADPDVGITAENAAETLAGQRIYTPLGNVTHFKLLKMLEHLGVDTSTVELIQSQGSPAAVAALDSGAVAMACAFGGAVNQMIANGGNLVMTGAEQEAIGIRVFDTISTTVTFATEHPDIITGFLQVTENINVAYNDDRAPFIDIIAGAAGMDRESTVVLLEAFSFPERDVQLSEAWLGGTVQQVMKDQMDFFVAQGEFASALESYDAFVDTSFLEAVEGRAAPAAPSAEEMMLDELNVAYFLEWPTANQAARVARTYDQALGLTVNWIPFGSGDDMAQAMEAGDIDISYSQGVTSFANFVTGGSDLLLVGVAVSYVDFDGENLVETGVEQEAIDIRVFDVISTSGDFADAYPSVVTGFLQVTEDANAAYKDDRAPFIDIIAEATDMDREATIALLDTFEFPEKDAQLSEEWLGGAVQQAIKEQMDSLAAQGEIESSLRSYDAFVDASFLEAVD